MTFFSAAYSFSSFGVCEHRRDDASLFPPHSVMTKGESFPGCSGKYGEQTLRNGGGSGGRKGGGHCLLGHLHTIRSGLYLVPVKRTENIAGLEKPKWGQCYNYNQFFDLKRPPSPSETHATRNISRLAGVISGCWWRLN